MYAVYRVDWIEFERGWGQRPDGYSLHVDKVECDRYINAYWDKLPSETPDIYSRPGTSRIVEVDVDTFNKVVSQKTIRF